MNGISKHGSRYSRRALLRASLLATAAIPMGLRYTAAQRGDGDESVPFFTPPTREAIRKGLAYLDAHQNDDGSFGTGTYGRNAAICALAAMAFLASGSTPGRGLYGSNIDRCLDFILETARPNGLIHHEDSAARGPMYSHGFAALFLAQIYGMSARAEVREKLSKAVRLIVGAQNTEGGWRYKAWSDEADISVTVCQVMALRAARNSGLYVPSEVIDHSLDYIKACQNPDGGFMYMLSRPRESEFPRSAAAIVALYSAGIYEGEEIERGLAYLMRFVPQEGQQGRQNYFMYGHYYAAQAMWHAGGDYWESWYPAVRDVLLEQQRENGSWFDMINAHYGTAMACLVLQMPQNYLPIFQR